MTKSLRSASQDLLFSWLLPLLRPRGSAQRPFRSPSASLQELETRPEGFLPCVRALTGHTARPGAEADLTVTAGQKGRA